MREFWLYQGGMHLATFSLDDDAIEVSTPWMKAKPLDDDINGQWAAQLQFTPREALLKAVGAEIARGLVTGDSFTTSDGQVYAPTRESHR